MADTAILSQYFETIQNETLRGLGISDPLASRIIAARLVIERLGERDVNYWWDSQVLNSFGRGTLEEITPRTATRSRIELAMQVGQKVENEAIEGDAVSLYDLGPVVESRIERELDDIDGKENFTSLEEYSTEISEPGWTASWVAEESTMDPVMGRTFELGAIDIDDLQTKEFLEDVVSQLIYGYGQATKDELKIPYYSVKG